VYGDVYPPEVEIVKQKLEWGLHNVKLTPFFADTLSLELTLRGAFGKKLVWGDVADVLYKGMVVQVIPVVKYEMRFPGALPIIEKYFLVYPNGTITSVRPETVKAFHVPVLPEEVAREWVECLRLKNWVQAVFFHNTFTIRDVGDNPQPYLLPDKSGHLWWVFVAEPPGIAYSAYMLLLIDAESTKPIIYVYKFKKPEIGVSKVKSYIMKAHPNWAWDNLLIQEPMPSFLNNTLVWKVAITTLDARGLISVEFLNASSGTVKSSSIKGKLTAEELLEGLRAGITFNKNVVTLQEVLKKIEKLKKELNELERLVKELVKSK